jgi:uncharacterized lipoprotein YmbA
MLLRPLGLFGVALLSTGCISGPESTVFVMSGPLAARSTTATDGDMPSVQVATVSLPAFLDNDDILVRHGPYALDASKTGHWGERLSLGLTHALAADLTRKLPGVRVGLERSLAPSGRRLQVEVDSFDVYPDGHCVLAANWSVVAASGAAVSDAGASGAAPPAFGRGVFATPASGRSPADDEEIVRAMAQATAELADAILASL